MYKWLPKYYHNNHPSLMGLNTILSTNGVNIKLWMNICLQLNTKSFIQTYYIDIKTLTSDIYLCERILIGTIIVGEFLYDQVRKSILKKHKAYDI